jgi:hypothetical protein
MTGNVIRKTIEIVPLQRWYLILSLIPKNCSLAA